MNAIKLLLSLTIIIVATNCNNNNSKKISVEEAINFVSGCISSSHKCPDTLFISKKNEIDQTDFISLMNPCFNNLEFGNLEDYTRVSINSMADLSLVNGNAKSFDFNQNWIPPRVGIKERAYFLYYDPLINQNSGKMLVPLTRYNSGKSIEISICVYNWKDDVPIFDKCYCSLNPF